MAKHMQYSHGAAPDAIAASEPCETSGAAGRAPSLGQLLGFSEQGFPVIRISGDEDAVEVPTTVVLGPEDLGCAVLVTYVDGRTEQPLVTGRVQPPRTAEQSAESSAAKVPGAPRIEADGEVITIEADREIVLRCGKACLRLRKDGFVEVRGIDVVSRAERSNWIKGGSVSLN